MFRFHYPPLGALENALQNAFGDVLDGYDIALVAEESLLSVKHIVSEIDKESKLITVYFRPDISIKDFPSLMISFFANLSAEFKCGCVPDKALVEEEFNKARDSYETCFDILVTLFNSGNK